MERQVSIKQCVGDNCAAIKLQLLPLHKLGQLTLVQAKALDQAIKAITISVNEMQQVTANLDTSAGFLIIEVHSGCRLIASMITKSMIEDAIKVDKSIDIIRMSDGQILTAMEDDRLIWSPLGKLN